MLAVGRGEFVDQGGLSRPRRPGDADDVRRPGVLVQSRDQVAVARPAVLDLRDDAGERPVVAVQQVLDELGLAHRSTVLSRVHSVVPSVDATGPTVATSARVVRCPCSTLIENCCRGSLFGVSVHPVMGSQSDDRPDRLCDLCGVWQPQSVAQAIPTPERVEHRRLRRECTRGSRGFGASTRDRTGSHRQQSLGATAPRPPEHGHTGIERRVRRRVPRRVRRAPSRTRRPSDVARGAD